MSDAKFTVGGAMEDETPRLGAAGQFSVGIFAAWSTTITATFSLRLSIRSPN
jgi:hypothetical protein